MIEMITHPVRTDYPHVTIRSDESDWTAEDWELLDHENGTLYEIIDGVLYMSTSPSLFHGFILHRLYRALGIPFEDAGLGYVFQAPSGLFMPGAQPVQPDMFFVKVGNTSTVFDSKVEGVPDLIVEVLSPGNTDLDLKIKYALYERAGVPEYVVIRPRERALTHFRLGSDGKYADVGTFSENTEVTFDLAPTIRFRVQRLFDGAPSTKL